MKIRNLFGLVVIAIMMTTGVQAQNLNMNQQQQEQIEVNDSELQTFADIMEEARNVQRNSRTKIMNAIKENGIEMKRFQEIAQAKQQGNQVEMTNEEKKAYSAIQEVMKQEQQKMRDKMSSVLKKYSMDQQRYMAINRALRGNKELQKRLRKMMSSQQQQ